MATRVQLLPPSAERNRPLLVPAIHTWLLAWLSAALKNRMRSKPVCATETGANDVPPLVERAALSSKSSASSLPGLLGDSAKRRTEGTVTAPTDTLVQVPPAA